MPKDVFILGIPLICLSECVTKGIILLAAHLLLRGQGELGLSVKIVEV